MSALIASASTDTIGLVFTFFVLMPAIAVGVVIVAVVSARGEKREDEQSRSKRWGRRRGPAGES
ncbi:MAG TPA: hypothetical protein VM299_04610 [Solirubrobacteraceae bacterium]|jgi:hypothetical protein|nr:hypothetical protein [Solirubrobacteraceae bacterium]